jgi:hypothetical protein
MRHEEAVAFAAAAEALLTGRLTACAGSCGPGSLHFIKGLYEANRNRAPVILIATPVRLDLGFESFEEIDYNDVFRGCSVYCEIVPPFPGPGRPPDFVYEDQHSACHNQCRCPHQVEFDPGLAQESEPTKIRVSGPLAHT